MTEQIDYNKQLKKIVNERLKPYGIFQQGKSRTFLYDKEWYTIVIEFQPSSWSKGTSLNIGIDFNFYPRDYFAFAHGYREKGFDEFKNEEHFNKLVNELCDRTIKRVEQLNQEFQDIWTSLKTLDKEKGKDAWRLYEVAVLNALTSNFNEAVRHFRQVNTKKCEYDWEIQRKQKVDELISWIQNKPTFLNNAKKLINETRQFKKLPIITLDQLTERKSISNSAFQKARPNWLNRLFGS